MKKKITIITIVLAMNLFILACLNGGYGWEPTLEVPAIVGEPTFVVNEEEGEVIVSVPLHPIPTLVPETSEPSTTNSEIGSSKPIEANQGTHTYTSQAFSSACICQDAGVTSSNFTFTSQGVSDGTFDFLKTGENTYLRSWTGQSILVVDGKETTIDVEKHTQLIFNEQGYILENYSDYGPGGGSPCCYYVFTLEK